MADWTMQQAKQDFRRGLFRSCHVERLPLDGGWTVVLVSTLPLDSSGGLLDARKGERRLFRSLDAAVRTLEQVGFKCDRLEVRS